VHQKLLDLALMLTWLLNPAVPSLSSSDCLFCSRDSLAALAGDGSGRMDDTYSDFQQGSWVEKSGRQIRSLDPVSSIEGDIPVWFSGGEQGLGREGEKHSQHRLRCQTASIHLPSDGFIWA